MLLTKCKYKLYVEMKYIPNCWWIAFSDMGCTMKLCAKRIDMLCRIEGKHFRDYE